MSRKAAPAKKMPLSATASSSAPSKGSSPASTVRKSRKGLIAGILALLLLLGGVGVYWALSSPAKPSFLDVQISHTGTIINPFSENGKIIRLPANRLLYIGPKGSFASFKVTISNPNVLTYAIFTPYHTTAKMPILYPFSAGGATKVTVKQGTNTSTFTVVVKPRTTPTTSPATSPDLTTKPYRISLVGVNHKILSYPENSALLIGPTGSKVLYSVLSSNPKVAMAFSYQLHGIGTPAIRIFAPGTTHVKVTWGKNVSSFTLHVTK